MLRRGGTVEERRGVVLDFPVVARHPAEGAPEVGDGRLPRARRRPEPRGTTGALVPREHGGAGRALADLADELVAHGRAQERGPWLSTAVAAPRTLARLGAGPGAAALLAGIAEGATVATVAIIERDQVGGLTGGSSRPTWTDPTTTATRRGGALVLTGEKADVPDAADATVVLVLAADRDGPALFAVDARAPGVEVVPTVPSSTLRLDGAPARRLGPAPDDRVRALVDDLLAVRAADALGTAEALLDQARDAARTASRRRVPAGALQAVRCRCVDMFETVEHARTNVLAALRSADTAGAADHHLAAVRAKAFSGRLARVGDTAIDVLELLGAPGEADALPHQQRLLEWTQFLGTPAAYLDELGCLLTQPAPRRRSTR